MKFMRQTSFFRQVRDQWLGVLTLLGMAVLFVQMSSMQNDVKRLSTRLHAPSEHNVRSYRSISGDVNAVEAASPKLYESVSVTSTAPSVAKSVALSQNKSGGDSSTAPATKEPYKWPVPLPEWELVDESEANETPLQGEGIVDEYITMMPREGDGVLFNAIHRTPKAKRASKPIMEAIVGARRMRAASQEAGGTSALKFCLVTDRAAMEFMMNEELCRPLWPECIDFKEKIKVFDTILYYDDFKMPSIVERRERFQTWPELWLKRIMASINSPFERTLVVDSDVYGCTVYETLFTEYLSSDVDVAITLAPAPFGASRNYPGAFRSGFSKDFANYTERNLGLHLLATNKPVVQKLLVLFRDVFIRQANDTDYTSIGNDQCAFREAMWTLKKSEGLIEKIIPAEIGCRHEAGCADGCYVVHRHSNQELSRAELQQLAKQKAMAKKAQKAEAAAAAAAE